MSNTIKISANWFCRSKDKRARQAKSGVSAFRLCSQAHRLGLRSVKYDALASLYAAFEPVEAARLVGKLELVHRPKHGSWLNMAEPELSVLTRQCLRRHMAKAATIASEAMQWATERNAAQIGTDWHFTTKQARIKLKYLYPKIRT